MQSFFLQHLVPASSISEDLLRKSILCKSYKQIDQTFEVGGIVGARLREVRQVLVVGGQHGVGTVLAAAPALALVISKAIAELVLVPDV